MAENRGKNNHVVMFPYMAQGHFIPFLRLADLLAAQGLAVSFLTTTANASKLQSQLKSVIRLVSLPFPPIDGLPPGCESVDALSFTDSQLLFFYSHKLSGPFEEWLEKMPQKPLCIISDVFLYWTADSASRFGIPRIVFHTTGAFGASLLQYLFTNPVSEFLRDDGTVEIRDHSLNVNLAHSQILWTLESESSSRYPVLLVLRGAFALSKESCAATLVNTLDAVEEGYVRYLQESTGKPVWGIAAPLNNEAQLAQSESECMQWLDRQKPKSVLYISFGSQVFLSEEQIKALARGIEGSRQPFLWTIKDRVGSNVNSCKFLPEGFVEATKDRGMVVHGWVPQNLILSHSSTACFLTHCGWNSTMESICAGVPMVVWPMIFDQSFNAKLVVEELRIGLQICEGFDQIPNSGIVERVVRAIVAEEIGREMGKGAEKVKDLAERSPSQLNIECFVSYILNYQK